MCIRDSFENLAKKTDKTKAYTERIVKNTEAVLVPNPGESESLAFPDWMSFCGKKIICNILIFSAARLETFMFDNIPVEKMGVKNTRLTNLEYLGSDMVEAGNEFGPGTPYGKGKRLTIIFPTFFSLKLQI